MTKQIAQHYENYGKTAAPEGINKFLDAHPGYRVVSVTPTVIEFTGGEIGYGVLVVFEAEAR